MVEHQKVPIVSFGVDITRTNLDAEETRQMISGGTVINILSVIMEELLLKGKKPTLPDQSVITAFVMSAYQIYRGPGEAFNTELPKM